MTDKSIKSALESLLFVWGEPLEAKTAAELFNIPAADMLELLRQLAGEYASWTKPSSSARLLKTTIIYAGSAPRSRKNASARRRLRSSRSSHTSSP